MVKNHVLETFISHDTLFGETGFKNCSERQFCRIFPVGIYTRGHAGDQKDGSPIVNSDYFWASGSSMFWGVFFLCVFLGFPSSIIEPVSLGSLTHVHTHILF